MHNLENPFFITGYIPDEYFCDRRKETDWLISLLTNHNNVVLISPRRMGKTSLVEHFYHKKIISDNFYTFYVDILPTTSLSEMVSLLGKKIYETLLPKGRKILNDFLSALTSLKSVLGYDALSGLPTLTFSVGSIKNPEATLEDIFSYLASADRPCIVAVDEFQQISQYQEKNVEALLRTHIQKLRNCNFIFSGSERHMMYQMFKESSRPFYNSAETIELECIPKDVYIRFITSHFQGFDKTISDDLAGYIYDLMEGNTYFIQRLCNRAFALTPVAGECDAATVEKALNQLIEINKTYFDEHLSRIPAKQKLLLYAVARSGSCQSIFSADFINANRLISASNVQHSARQLVAASLLTADRGTYTLTDKLLAAYIRRQLL